MSPEFGQTLCVWLDLCAVSNMLYTHCSSALVIITKRALVYLDTLCAHEYLKSCVMPGRNFHLQQIQKTLEG